MNLSRAVFAVVLALAGSARAATADRGVAVWALQMGGFVVLEGDQRRIRDVADLPEQDFRIEVLNLVGANIHPPHMEAFAKLTALRELHLPAPMWNPRAESKTDYTSSAAHLAGLTSLRKLTLSFTFLRSVHFDEPALELLKPLGPTLEEMVIRRARVKGQAFRHFTNLRSLDLTWAFPTDEGMQSLAVMTKLKKLWLKDTPLSDRTLPALANLKELEELDLGGLDITDAGIAHLKGLTRLKKLDLLGANLSDAGLDHLAAMKDLEVLNLYGTKVSNAGLEKLKRFAKLRESDLRYTRATQAGVASLRAALPKAELLFLESSIETPRTAKALRGTGDAEVAAWIKSIGGKVTLKDGALVEIVLSGAAVSDGDLKNLSGLKHLRRLILDGTETGDLGARYLAGLSSLTELSLSSTGVSDAALEHVGHLAGLRKLHLDNTLIEGAGLAHLKNLKNLEELSLLGSPVKDAGLSVLPNLTALKSLSLATTDIGADALKHVGTLVKLERLDLTSTDIKDAGLEHIKGLTGLRELILDYSFRYTDAGFAHLAGLTNLRTLSLLRAPVTDKSMKTIAAFAQLEHLNLNYTNVTDLGIADLAALKNLKTLGLDSSYVTDKSRDVLLQLSNLKELNLYHTVVTDKVHAELKSGLAGCRIVWDANSAMPNRRRS